MNTDNTICINGKKCAECGTSLFKQERIAVTKDNMLFCADCAERIGEEPAANYAVLGNKACLILDSEAERQIREKYEKIIFCNNIRERSGKMCLSDLEDDAIVLFELCENTPNEALPQAGLFEQSSSFTIQLNFAKRMKERVAVRKDRVSNRSLIFFKTNGSGDTEDIIDELRTALIKENPKNKRGVYMERITGDDGDLAKTMLAELKCKCTYYDGVTYDSSNAGETLFPVEFTAKELYDYLRSRIIGQDEALRTVTYLIMDHVEKTARDKPRKALDWILTAPSGSGKTELQRAVADFFEEHNVPVPVIRCDLSQITETGYKGKEVSSIVGQISSAAKKEYGNSAICFLDEADKKLVPSVGSGGTDYNANAQANLLSMVEGSVVENSDGEPFDTSNTMFIFMGAFQTLRDEKRLYGEMLDEANILDGAVGKTGDDKFYDDITINEMVSFGMIEELAGRLRMVVNFKKPSEDSMRHIIRSKCDQIAAEQRCMVSITEGAVEEFLLTAYTNLGIRSIINKLSDMVIRKLADSLEYGDIDRNRDILVIEGADKISVRKKRGRREGTGI